MEPFNLEEAKAGKPVVTRGGKPARIVCWDRKNEFYPILALVGEKEEPLYFTTEGRFYNLEESCLDLLMAPEKHEGWINIYNIDKINDNRTTAGIFLTEEQAIESGKKEPDYITTIKIEWEE